MDYRTLLFVAPLLTALSSPARAQTAPLAPAPLVAPSSQGAATPDAQPESETQWYGGRLMLVDGLSVAAMIMGGGSGVTAVGFGGIFLAAPIVHLTEGRAGAAFGSLGLRVAMPLAGMFIGGAIYSAGHQGDASCRCMGGIAEAAGGAMLGLLGAMALDYAFLGLKPSAEGPRAGIAIVPTATIAQNAGSLGLAGRF
jgi:hypothetical protein